MTNRKALLARFAGQPGETGNLGRPDGVGNGVPTSRKRIDKVRFESSLSLCTFVTQRIDVAAPAESGVYGTAPWWGLAVKSAIAAGERSVRFRPVLPERRFL